MIDSQSSRRYNVVKVKVSGSIFGISIVSLSIVLDSSNGILKFSNEFKQCELNY